MTYINNINSENEPTGDYKDLPIKELKDKRRKETKHDKQVIWRRQKIFSLLVQGITSTYDLASALHISQSTAAGDVQFLKSQATEQMRTHISERLPWEYRICTEGMAEVLRYAWSLIQQEDARNKVAILSLIVQCYKDLLDLSTNATVVTDALQQVERMKNQILELDG
jgi:conjugal transfer/entry exclusion protein